MICDDFKFVIEKFALNDIELRVDFEACFSAAGRFSAMIKFVVRGFELQGTRAARGRVPAVKRLECRAAFKIIKE
jgi:hypothetical protein